MTECKTSIIKTQQAKAVRATGSRFKEAREEICNMSLNHAARQLGYSNASKLSKVEHAADTNSVPLWLIIAASKLYEVSTDFLLGTSDDWEYSARKTQEREVSRFQAEAMEKSIRDSCNMNLAFNDELEWASGAIITMAFTLDEIADALKRVTEINRDAWQEIKGGSKLQGEVDKAAQLVMASRTGLNRFKRPCVAKGVGRSGLDVEDSKATIRQLAALGTIAYYQARREWARLLDLPIKILDRLVNEERCAQEQSAMVESQAVLEFSDGR